MTKRKPQRQGDVLLIPIGKVPAGLKPVDRDKRGRIVLAEGEVTGHAHVVLDGEAALFASEDLDDLADRFLQVEAETVEVTHDEHDTNVLEKGAWIVRPKREYAPAVSRAVMD